MPDSSEISKAQITGTFFKMSGWYLFYMPIKVPYTKIISKAESLGFKVKKSPSGGFNGILERGVKFGKGWIAVEIEDTQNNHPDVFKVNEEFKSFEHKGSYKKLGDTYKNVMKTCPDAIDFYNLYVNSPQDTKEEDLRTIILVR